MNALLIALMLTADPIAPALEIVEPQTPLVVRVREGFLVPFDGILMSDDAAVAQARRIVKSEAELASWKKADPATLNVPLVVGVLVGVLVVGGLSGYGIAQAVR